jgi:hypothetical protein
LIDYNDEHDLTLFFSIFSECWKTLAAAKSALGEKTTTRDINPKAISPKELYGYISLKTREWKDGALSQLMRDLGQMTDDDPVGVSLFWTGLSLFWTGLSLFCFTVLDCFTVLFHCSGLDFHCS